MNLVPNAQPSRIASCFSMGGRNELFGEEVPPDSRFVHQTIESAEKARLEDDRFDKLKPIIRSLYKEPHNQSDYPPDKLQELYKSLGNLKVYPHKEGSNITIRAPFLTFEDAFGSHPAILAEIRKNGFEKPSPVQSQMWPTFLDGRDCVGVSQTGSGKTLAFLLPAFLHIDAQYTLYNDNEIKPRPSVLVLTPTRELAQQIEQEVEKYSYNGYKSVCVYGGGDRRGQIARCQSGVEIVIATPGRLADLSAEGVINLASVTYVVLDEADRMLDMGFEPSIKRILFEIRPDRIVALTSATWPESVRNLAQKYTKDAVMVVVGTLDLTACATVKQYIEILEDRDKFDRMCGVVRFLNETYGQNYKMIIFVKSKVLADHLSSDFCLKGISSQGLHGGRSQSDRENSLRALRTGEIQILIATDLASRGIDIPDITHVCNYDFPGDIEEYVHRVGRTGRAGKRGEALTFMTWQDRSHAKELIEILEKSNQDIPKNLYHLAERHVQNVAKYGERPKRSFRNRSKNDNFQTSY